MENGHLLSLLHRRSAAFIHLQLTKLRQNLKIETNGFGHSSALIHVCTHVYKDIFNMMNFVSQRRVLRHSLP